MASETMELDCPSCELVLEIDIAFAGGVCRCSSCGTLMTVPRDPKHERAESLQRPDRPDGPAGSTPPQPQRPSAPLRPDAPAGSQTPAQSTVPPVDSAPVSSPRPTAPAGKPSAGPAGAPVDEGVYVTASGKEVRITSQTRIPTAVKRKALKISIVTGFVVVMVAMVAVVLIGIAFMLNSGESEKRTADQVAADVQVARGNYDPDVNPFLLSKPNVLGLDITGSVVIVLDTSNESNKWLSMAADALIRGLGADASSGGNTHENLVAQVIFARDGGPTTAPEKLTKLDNESRVVLKDALYNTKAIGQATLAPAMNMAVASKPAQIILITSQDINEDRLKSIIDPLGQNQPAPQFDVIYLGQQSGQLQETVSKHNGKLVKLPVLSLRTWYQAWMDQQQSEASE